MNAIKIDAYLYGVHGTQAKSSSIAIYSHRTTTPVCFFFFQCGGQWRLDFFCSHEDLKLK